MEDRLAGLEPTDAGCWAGIKTVAQPHLMECSDPAIYHNADYAALADNGPAARRPADCVAGPLRIIFIMVTFGAKRWPANAPIGGWGQQAAHMSERDVGLSG